MARLVAWQPLSAWLGRHRRGAFYLALVAAGALNGLVTTPSDAVPSLVLAVVTPASVLLLRAAPRVALAAALIVLVLISLSGRDSGLAVTALAVVLVTYAGSEPGARPVPLFVVSGGAVALSAYCEAVTRAEAIAPSTFVFGIFGTALAVGLGVSLRLHRQALAELDARNRELEELRITEARRAVVEERTRIARELHDVVAHHVSAIIVRAQAAEHVRLRRPHETDAALRYVIEAAGETLTALRRMVGLLRTDAPSGSDHPVDGADPDRAPQPALADLPFLVRSAREAGAAVVLAEVGDPQSMPLDVQLTAFRVVQEGLTNSLKHAPAAPVTVSLRWTSEALVVVVENPSSSPPPSTMTGGAGHGLLGMHERLTSCGGRLDAGPTSSRGWRVRATIPVPGAGVGGAEPVDTAPDRVAAP